MKKYLLTLVCMVMALIGYGQATTVTGTVYEPSGDTAIGASVVEKGQTGGAVTDLDGNFSIKVSSPNATLVISYIGMETQEIKLAGRTHIDVHLKDAAEALEELVVVGYGTQKKINATGAVKTIDNEVLESRPLSNAVQGLQGAVAGLNITNDAGGAPGSEMNINIRGVGSIGEGSNSAPLVLIDGMEGDLSSINPNDIESISVLKDAAAASIYGSRAPFGVILVTTKSGTNMGVRVNYSGNVRFQTPKSVPHRVDSYTMALMVNEAYLNSGGSVQFSQRNLDRILQYQQGLLQDATEAENDTKWKETFQSWANTDWYDVYMKNVAVSQEHNASVTGGSDKTKYYFSANYLDQAGIFRYADEKYQRLALTGKVNVTFNKYVNFNWTSRIIATKNDKPSALNTLFYHNLGRRYATEPVYLPNGEYHPKSLIPSITKGGRETTKTQQFYNQANLIVTPIENWNIHAELNSRIEHNPYERQFKPVSVTGPNGDPIYIAVLEGVNATHNPLPNGNFQVNPAAGESYYERANTAISYFSTNFYTDYTLRLGDSHNFKFLLGMQTERFHREIDRVANAEVAIPDTPFIPSEAGGATTMTSQVKGTWTSMGFFGRINYNYADRYMLEFNMRGDGASRFPKDKRWGYFPSVSIGWNIANEKFWEPWTLVCNYLKLRGSYGVLGNQNTTSFYPYYQRMVTSAGNAILGGAQTSILPVYDPYSTSLTWEKIENAGAGLDWALFHNKLQGAFDWYQRTTKDMVGPAMALPGVYGGDAPKTNNAELRTRGWELELSWRSTIGKDFSYTISGSLSDYKTKVTKYDSPTNEVRKWYQGKESGEIWGYKVLGIAKSNKEMAEYQAQHPQTAIGTNWGGGDIMYQNLDDDPAINSGAGTLDNHGDLTVIGNTTPRYAYSFTLEAQWKFIDFRAYFQGIGKRDYFIGMGEDNPIGTSTFFGFGGGPWQFTPFVDHLDYFRYADSPLGANFDSYYGRLRTDRNNIQYCDRFLQDASYLRLKNLTVGFTLPENAGLKKYINKARLYFSAENLFTWTKLKIFDPEALQGSDSVYDGGAGKTYPQYRTYSIGLELTF